MPPCDVSAWGVLSFAWGWVGVGGGVRAALCVMGAFVALQRRNMSLGHKEGHEYERVLFYYPQFPPESMSPDEWDALQTRNVGLAAALVGFT